MDPLIYVAIGTVIVCGITIFLVVKGETERSEQIKEFAESNGYSYENSANENLMAVARRFDLFNQRPMLRDEIVNVLSKREASTEITLCDYVWQNNTRQRGTLSRSVLMMRDAKLNLGQFVIKDKTFWKPSHDSVVIDGFSGFNNQFEVNASNGTMIRKTLTDDVLHALVRMAPISVEADADTLILYRNKRFESNELHPQLLTYGHELRELLQASRV